jgi:hypothetical protein
MPYYKGVHFEQAFHREEDLLAHNAATSGNPVVPAPAEPEPEPAVSVPDRLTPVVETAVTVEADPFPSFVQEEEPETQPQPVSDETVTPAETPDGKKKKTGRSGKG